MMKEFTTASLPKMAFIFCQTHIVPKIRIENSRGYAVFPVNEKVIAAIEDLKDPNISINYHEYQAAMGTIKEILFNSKQNL